MTSTHAAWCRQLFDSLADNGKWGVPRSGLTFTKQDGKLVLTELAPYLDGKTIGDAITYRKYQIDDFRLIKQQFAAAGIEVTDNSMTEGET